MQPRLIPPASAVLARNRLLRQGTTDTEIAEAIRLGSLRRLRVGAYVPQNAWSTMHTEQRQVSRATAAMLSARRERPVFSHITAAAIWGLPLIRMPDERIHSIGVDAIAQSTPGILRHRDAILEHDVVRGDDWDLTSFERTVFDVIRTTSRECAVGVMDAALRMLSVDDDGSRRMDPHSAAANDFRQALHRRIARSPGVRGIRQARFVVPFGDARAESVGESVSRLYLHDLGHTPLLQVTVAGPRPGLFYDVDFELEDALGEFDGEAKYRDPVLLGGRTPERAVIDEKLREDWIRGVRRKPLIRWSMRDLASPDTLAERLRAFGVRARARPTPAPRPLPLQLPLLPPPPATRPRTHPFFEITPD